MRTILIAMLVAAGVGWLGTSTLSAAPASGAAIGEAAATLSLLSDTQYYRRRGRTCYVKCYREFVVGPRVCRRYCGLF